MRLTSFRSAQLGLVVVLTLTLFMAKSALWPDPVTGSNNGRQQLFGTGPFGVAPTEFLEVVVPNPCLDSAATVDIQLINAVTGVVQGSGGGTIPPGEGHRLTLFVGATNPTQRISMRVVIRFTLPGSCGQPIRRSDSTPSVEIVDDATGRTNAFITAVNFGLVEITEII